MNILKKLSLLLPLFLSFQIWGQSPYVVSWKKEIPYLSGSAATLGLGAYFRTIQPVFTPDELLTLDKNDINALDRFATGNFSKNADHASDFFWFGSHAAPLLLLANQKSRSHLGQIIVLYGEAATINLGVTVITKSLFHRPRPFVFNPEVIEEMKLKANARTSFVSGHSSMTAMNTFFTAKVFSDFYPDSGWKPVVWTAAAVIPAFTGYLRVAAGKHYPTDVMAGYALGAAIGILVPHLHRNNPLKNNGLSISAGADSFYLVWQFNQ